MLPNLRNHSGVLLSLCVSAILFAGLVLGCDEYMKTNSLLTTGKKVNAEQLQGEAATKQGTINNTLTDLNASYQKLAQDATTFNANYAAAQADITAKQAQVASVIQTLSGVVGMVAKG